MSSYLKLVENPNYTDKLENTYHKPRFSYTRRLLKLTGGLRWVDKLYEEDNKGTFSCREGNMYLAEDRILCLKIYAQKGKDYYLSYVPDAFCKTDVIDSFVALMNQRRRWINGTWWAFWEVVNESASVFKRGKSCYDKWRVIPFFLSLLYAIVNMFLMWFVVALFYVIFSMSIEVIFEKERFTKGLFFSWITVFEHVYVLSICLVFFSSLMFKAKEVPRFYTMVSYILGLFNLVTTGMTFFFIYDQVIVKWFLTNGESGFDLLAILFFITIIGHAIPVVINGEIMTIIRGVFAFLFYSPSYINVLILYSFSNFDDLTWGNRTEGNNEKLAKLQQRAKSFKNFKMEYISWFAFTNVLCAYLIRTLISNNEDFRRNFTLFFGYLMGIILGLKSIGALAFSIKYFFCTRRVMKAVKKRLKKESQTRPKDEELSLSDVFPDRMVQASRLKWKNHSK
eukprot:TRINITY_DN15304_c0_g1_i3.p1 TRINITY_DN15304_c0_g1~~TRINITY_DN15304_c0_g1_i3.p1  ORF type:complete len:452 (-),score=98.62 TRINITY_DN15304_c0_g1_i3:25-1380(-)